MECDRLICNKFSATFAAYGYKIAVSCHGVLARSKRAVQIIIADAIILVQCERPCFIRADPQIDPVFLLQHDDASAALEQRGSIQGGPES